MQHPLPQHGVPTAVNSSPAAAGLAVLEPRLAFAVAANRQLDIGLIGCGGRGEWILRHFADRSGFNVVACSDYFQDRVDAVGEKFAKRKAGERVGVG